MAGLQTEFSFQLPKGYVDGDGNVHRRGSMRLATARDEIEPLRDSRVADADDPYLTLLVLSRVITSLGTMEAVTLRDVEGLFAADLAFLQDFYGVINFGTPEELEELRAAVPAEPPPPPPPPAQPDDPDPATTDDVVSVPEGFAAPGRRRAMVEEVPTAGGQ